MNKSGKIGATAVLKNNRLRNCIICFRKSLIRVIELGFHPLADTFIKKELVGLPQKLYPLQLNLCNNCGHLQVAYVVSPTERYIENDYSYTSANSKISRSHWREFAGTVHQITQSTQGDHVIEFGSNDGFLLQQFAKNGCKVSGIDPSPALVKVSRKNGIPAYQGFIDSNLLDKCTKKHGQAKLVVGNNVLNHIHNVNEVISAISRHLRSDGFFVFEVPYLVDLVQKYIFDLIYHEHISYFSVRALDKLLQNHGLYISRIEHNLYHGGCVRVYATPDKKSYRRQEVSDYQEKEQTYKLFTPDTYRKFMDKISRDKYQTLKKIYSLKSKGQKICAIGAGARGNTLLNFYKLDGSVVDFVTDNSRFKIGKYTPFSAIPIVPDARLEDSSISVGLILSWNIGKFLVDKIKKINPRLQFIVPGEKKLL